MNISNNRINDLTPSFNGSDARDNKTNINDTNHCAGDHKDVDDFNDCI